MPQTPTMPHSPLYVASTTPNPSTPQPHLRPTPSLHPKPRNTPPPTDSDHLRVDGSTVECLRLGPRVWHLIGRFQGGPMRPPHPVHHRQPDVDQRHGQ